MKPKLQDGLYQVYWRGICAGFEIKGGEVVACAPVLRRKLNFFMSIAKRIHCNTSLT